MLTFFKNKLEEIEKFTRQELNQLIEPEIRQEFQRSNEEIREELQQLDEEVRQELSQLNQNCDGAFFDIVDSVEKACEKLKETCNKLKETTISACFGNSHRLR